MCLLNVLVSINCPSRLLSICCLHCRSFSPSQSCFPTIHSDMRNLLVYCCDQTYNFSNLHVKGAQKPRRAVILWSHMVWFKMKWQKKKISCLFFSKWNVDPMDLVYIHFCERLPSNEKNKLFAYGHICWCCRLKPSLRPWSIHIYMSSISFHIIQQTENDSCSKSKDFPLIV